MNHINIDNIKKVILEQKEEIKEIFEKERIINREISEKKLLKYLNKPNIIAILGTRRSGKTLLSILLLKKKKYGYVNFDDERLTDIKKSDLNKILESLYSLEGEDLQYIILDEIQNIQGWELFANRLRRTKRVIITGSNAKLLSGELATHLTGRYISLELFPFSFKEVLIFKGRKLKKEYTTKEIAGIRNELEEYIKIGGFPEVYKIGRRMIQNIFDDIISRDIFMRHEVKYKSEFRDISKYLLSNFGCEITLTKLKNIFSIKDIHTIRDYVDYLEESYLIFNLEKISYKLKEQMIAPKKVYAIDTGIINSIAFQPTENKGRLYENIVMIDLLRRSNYNEDFEIYYWRDERHHEVDFVIKKGSEVRQLIQVCYDLSEEKTKEREVRNLINASKKLRCKNLLIITGDYEGQEEISWFGTEGTITFIPLWKWLLS